MDQTVLIEDIVSTKNTLTILHRVFIVNRISLQQFASIFDSISQLIDILTHSSATEIETALLSTGSNFVFSKLKDTLHELSDAITTNDTSTINSLNEQLLSCAQKLQIRSSYAANNGETADSIFKKKIRQQQINAEAESGPVCACSPVSSEASHTAYDVIDHKVPESKPHQAEEDDISEISQYHLEPFIALELSSQSKFEQQQEQSAAIDPFAEFRFARRQRPSISLKKVGANSASTLSSPSQKTKPRLMISYNHASKPLCVDIYNNLTKDGYKVWIDLQQMHGSTLVAMAQGIENSDIILYCVTEQYSLSPYCQKEAEYAFVQQKIMIPLLLQSKYKPRGWLGLLLGASLYLDFTKNNFTENYEKLKSEIEANAIRISSNKNEGPKLTLDLAENDEKQIDKTADNLLLQSSKANSQVTETKYRCCVLL